MKTLYLVRHGKSSWTNKELSDEERPLLVKGEEKTKLLSEYFIKKGVSPDLIISSHAVRAYETAKIIAAAIKYPEREIKTDRVVYFADGEGLFDPFYELSTEIDSVMLEGHNPAITIFANHFIENKIDSMPTSGALCIELKINDWHNIIKAKGKEVFRKFL
jgi:phosphohistidine phosphatase